MYINILDNTFIYKVTEKNIVKPDDLSHCQPVKDKDLLSLVTCYWYGNDKYRLIVTGERCLSAESETASADNDI